MSKQELFTGYCDLCDGQYPATVKFVKVYDEFNQSHWLEPLDPLSGSDAIAIWCGNCGPNHQSERNYRNWQEKKVALAS